jgi:hypothetical protein
LLNINQLKAKQTYIERLSFQCASYLQVNGTCCKETPPLLCETALEKAASWVDACASGASYWSTSNDTLLLSSLLEKLATIICSRHAIDFSLCIYTILMNIWTNNFEFLLYKKSTAPSLYQKLPKIFNPANRQHICHKPIDFVLFLLTILNNSISSHFLRDNIFNPKLTRFFVIKFNLIYSIHIKQKIWQ